MHERIRRRFPLENSMSEAEIKMAVVSGLPHTLQVVVRRRAFQSEISLYTFSSEVMAMYRALGPMLVEEISHVRNVNTEEPIKAIVAAVKTTCDSFGRSGHDRKDCHVYKLKKKCHSCGIRTSRSRLSTL
eukprot:GHVP01023898.1.p1 GENE.GHVP01023898.1~~GHVP01023898.1.p1  ORF type:complete len:130 (-),score=12.82 GHVP01023898.1:452-841(-)